VTAAAALAAALALVAAFPAASRAAQVERARYMMGTLFTARAAAEDAAAAAAALERALGEVDRLEQVMSSWRASSELSKVNRDAAFGWTSLSGDLYTVFRAALAAAEETRGAFDPTVEPLVAAWDLRGQGRVPDQRELATARAVVGWHRVSLDTLARSVRYERPGVAVDLGGIAKGYALDRAAAVLGALGVRDAQLNFGGEILALGAPRPEAAGPEAPAGGGEAARSAWAVELASPVDRGKPAVVIRVRDASVSTSGQGERGIEVKGRRYGHVLNPRTEQPVETRATVAVVCPSATRADALSTALLVMGRNEARRFALARPEIGVLWLEPGPGGRTRAWAWNLRDVSTAPGARVEWIEKTTTTEADSALRKEPPR
jgi:thiamine biosynthesis lipoprotein